MRITVKTIQLDNVLSETASQGEHLGTGYSNVAGCLAPRVGSHRKEGDASQKNPCPAENIAQSSEDNQEACLQVSKVEKVDNHDNHMSRTGPPRNAALAYLYRSRGMQRRSSWTLKSFPSSLQWRPGR